MRADTFRSRGIVKLEWSFSVRCKFELEGSRRWHMRESAYWYSGCKRRRLHPWVRKIPGGGNGNLLQYSYLENSMDRGA